MFCHNGLVIMLGGAGATCALYKGTVYHLKIIRCSRLFILYGTKRCSKIFVTIKSDFVFSSINMTNIQKTLNSTNVASQKSVGLTIRLTIRSPKCHVNEKYLWSAAVSHRNVTNFTKAVASRGCSIQTLNKANRKHLDRASIRLFRSGSAPRNLLFCLDCCLG